LVVLVLVSTILVFAMLAPDVLILDRDVLCLDVLSLLDSRMLGETLHVSAIAESPASVLCD
jgi:hypothetical protein